jgi:hypothetical protein
MSLTLPAKAREWVAVGFGMACSGYDILFGPVAEWIRVSAGKLEAWVAGT